MRCGIKVHILRATREVELVSTNGTRAARMGLCRSANGSPAGVEIVMMTFDEPEVVVEPALLRMKLGNAAEVGFAEPSGGIVQEFESITQGGFRDGQSEMRIAFQARCPGRFRVRSVAGIGWS